MTDPQTESVEKKSALEKEIQVKVNLRGILKAALLLALVAGIVSGSYSTGYKQGYATGEIAGKKLGEKQATQNQTATFDKGFVEGYMEAYDDIFHWTMRKDGFYIVRVMKVPPASVAIDKRFATANKKLEFSMFMLAEMTPGQKYFIKGNTVWLNN